MQGSVVLRGYAQEFLRVAAGIASEKDRQFLIEIATRWHAMALEREREERVTADMEDRI
jgi:hypothetical protein